MNLRNQRGFNLFEVVVAIVVFFIGMLALAALQGSLTRSMLDAKVRTEATNLAERALENMRGFTDLLPTAGAFDYSEIVDNTTTETTNGVTYTIVTDVTDYWYQQNGDTFTTTTNGQATSTFKQVEVVVRWNTAQMLRTGEGETSAAALGSGDVTDGVDADGNPIAATGIKVTGLIPALVTSASARVAEEDEADLPTPGISYTPGLRPDVIALSLGRDRFKESLLPQPIVIRSDKVETTFDVITFATNPNNNTSTFLRREEFTAVSCDCTLKAADGDNPGRRPVVWAGDEYAAGHFVTKPYGESATNQQSDLCDTCCRDHHDGGSGSDDSSDLYANVYGPFKASGEYTGTARASNHKHYQSDGVTIAGVNDDYEEVCRMVRVDGFFRVAQDFRREDQYAFPEDFLDSDAEVEDYSDYVTAAAAAFHGLLSNGYPTNSPPCIGLYDYDSNPLTDCDFVPTMQGAPTASRADGELASWTDLKDVNKETQQLRSRGIYIDYVTNDFRKYMKDFALGGCIDTAEDPDEPIENCCVVNGTRQTTAVGCDVENKFELDQIGAAELLPVLPFFEVQKTFLDDWREQPSGTVVNTTSEALDDFNQHSRGLVSQVALGSAQVTALGHRGNTGFTDTPAIDPQHASHITNASITVCSLDSSGAGACGATPPPPSGNPIVKFNLTDTVNPTPSTDFVQVDDAICQPGSTTDGECEVPTVNNGAKVKVFNYGKVNKDRWACSSTLVVTGTSVTNGAIAETTFDLVGADPTVTHVINIQSTACSP